MSEYEVVPVTGIPPVSPGDDLGSLIVNQMQRAGLRLQDGDIVVVTHKVVSISEGRVVDLRTVEVSRTAERIASLTGRDPRVVQVALDEADEVLVEAPVLITRTRAGIVTDMSGVDLSNATEGYVVLLPRDPDASAERLRTHIQEWGGVSVGVIITDTQGRPWRRGAVNVCIGVSGIDPFVRNAGKTDLFGRVLKSSLICVADEIAAAAELVMGQADEGVPVAVVRGLRVERTEGTATSILRDPAEDLFARPKSDLVVSEDDHPKEG